MNFFADVFESSCYTTTTLLQKLFVEFLRFTDEWLLTLQITTLTALFCKTPSNAIFPKAVMYYDSTFPGVWRKTAFCFSKKKTLSSCLHSSQRSQSIQVTSICFCP